MLSTTNPRWWTSSTSITIKSYFAHETVIKSNMVTSTPKKQPVPIPENKLEYHRHTKHQRSVPRSGKRHQHVWTCFLPLFSIRLFGFSVTKLPAMWRLNSIAWVFSIAFGSGDLEMLLVYYHLLILPILDLEHNEFEHFGFWKLMTTRVLRNLKDLHEWKWQGHLDSHHELHLSISKGYLRDEKHQRWVIPNPRQIQQAQFELQSRNTHNHSKWNTSKYYELQFVPLYFCVLTCPRVMSRLEVWNVLFLLEWCVLSTWKWRRWRNCYFIIKLM